MEEISKTIPLYTSTDVSRSNKLALRTFLDHVRQGKLPAPAIKFPSSRGIFVWTEAQLEEAGLKVPRKASITLSLY